MLACLSVIFGELQRPTQDFSQRMVSGQGTDGRCLEILVLRDLSEETATEKIKCRTSTQVQNVQSVLKTLAPYLQRLPRSQVPQSQSSKSERKVKYYYTSRYSSTVPPISCRSLSDWLVRELSLQNHCLRWTLATSCSMSAMSAFSPQTIQFIN